MRKFLASVLAVIALVASGPAMAATLYLNGGASNNNGGKQFSNGDVTVRVTGWSIDRNGKIRNASVGVWSYGLGVDNTVSSGGDGSHTVDNEGWTDFLIFQFDNAVELGNAAFRTGWHGYNDTDATIGFGMSALPIGTNLNLAGMNASTLSSFNLFDSNASSGNSFRNINPSDNVGNVWLIGASFTNQDHRLDGFKLKKLTYTQVPVVPEPGTWLMMILGFGLIGGVMRQSKGARRIATA